MQSCSIQHRFSYYMIEATNTHAKLRVNEPFLPHLTISYEQYYDVIKHVIIYSYIYSWPLQYLDYKLMATLGN